MGRKKIEYTKNCITCNKEFNPGKHKSTLNCSKECFNLYKEKTKESRMEATRLGILKKYGVEHPSQIKDFSEKVKNTKKEKYGDENYNNRSKAENTLEEKYGVKNSMKLESSVIKSKETKKEKYKDENYNNRNKAKETIKERYGVEHHLQNEECLNKMIETNKKKYNVDYQFNRLEIKEKLKNKNLENFDSEYFFSSKGYLLKTKEEKIKRIKEIFKENNLSFNEEDYIKLREEDNVGKLRYLFYEIKCNNCGSIFQSKLTNNIPICRTCYPIASNSIIQLEIEDFLKSLNISFLKNKRDIIKPLELDIYIPEHNFAIEINGNYFHSEIGGDKNKYYHITKSQLCNDKKIKLIHIFEDEWLLKKEIVKSEILKNLNLIPTQKICAKDCVLKEISNEEKISFLNKNHIQGNCIDKYRFGLFYDNELISVMSFIKKTNDYEFELIRFANKINTNVVGAFSKLLNHFIENYKPKKIISYADIRWFGLEYENIVYYKNKFSFIEYTKPNYYYVNKKDYLTRMHRFSLKKDLLLEMFPESNPQKSEWQIAMKNGFDRIWDCGTMKFEINF